MAADSPGKTMCIRKGDRIGLPDVVMQVRDAHDGSTIMESIRRIHVEGDISSSESIDFSPVELADLDGNRRVLLEFSRELHDAGDENRLYGDPQRRQERHLSRQCRDRLGDGSRWA